MEQSAVSAVGVRERCCRSVPQSVKQKAPQCHNVVHKYIQTIEITRNGSLRGKEENRSDISFSKKKKIKTNFKKNQKRNFTIKFEILKMWPDTTNHSPTVRWYEIEGDDWKWTEAAKFNSIQLKGKTLLETHPSQKKTRKQNKSHTYKLREWAKRREKVKKTKDGGVRCTTHDDWAQKQHKNITTHKST